MDCLRQETHCSQPWTEIGADCLLCVLQASREASFPIANLSMVECLKSDNEWLANACSQLGKEQKPLLAELRPCLGANAPAASF